MDTKHSKGIIKHLWVAADEAILLLDPPADHKDGMVVLEKNHGGYESLFAYILSLHFTKRTGVFTCNTENAKGRGVISYMEAGRDW